MTGSELSLEESAEVLIYIAADNTFCCLPNPSCVLRELSVHVPMLECQSDNKTPVSMSSACLWDTKYKGRIGVDPKVRWHGTEPKLSTPLALLHPIFYSVAAAPAILKHL